MNLMTFLIIAFISILTAIMWEAFFYVIPAKIKSKKEQSIASLTKYLANINKKVLLKAKIKDGEHLHDITYKSLLYIICKQPKPNFKMIKNVQYNEENETSRIQFRKELELLDNETKGIVDKAINAASKVLFFSNPLVFAIFIGKMLNVMIDYSKAKEEAKEKMIRSTEYYISQKNKELNECLNH